jgi:hypothetical protein
MGYVEMIGALSAERQDAARLELLLGWHPERQRWMTEEEERAWEDLQYLSASALEEDGVSGPWIDALELWGRYFPELREDRGRRMKVKELWGLTLRRVDVLRLGYAFYPVLDHDPNRPGERFTAIQERAREIQRAIEEGIGTDARAKGRITWTLPFPADGPLGSQVEIRAGLSHVLREGIGLGGIVPGLLHNYCYEHASEIHEQLSPRQFEELVGSVYEADGWDVRLTRVVKDGGKDAIATKEIDGRVVVAYVEAKRYRAGRAVGLSEVKEFAATIAGDQVDCGMLVSTSHFSRPVSRWIKDAGVRVATVELVDLPQFRSFLGRVVTGEVGSYLLD